MSLQGWMCPVCGSGVSPMIEVCPCRTRSGWDPQATTHTDKYCGGCGKFPCQGTTTACQRATISGGNRR